MEPAGKIFLFLVINATLETTKPKQAEILRLDY